MRIRNLRPGIASVMIAALAVTGQEPQRVSAPRAVERLFASLEGEWTFEWRGATQPQATQTGRRLYSRLGGNTLQLAWQETFDGSERAGNGVLWYDTAAEQLLYFGLYRPDALSMLLRGTLDSTGTVVQFRLVQTESETTLNAGLVESLMRVGSEDGHTWHRFDDGWIVTFRRRR